MSTDQLAKRALSLLKDSGKDRVVITIAGIPGSGKSTTAAKVASALNALSPGIAAVVGMDGFHYTRAQLDKFEDPAKAHKFRGAAFTFDAEKVVDLASRLHNSSESCPVPTFDHAKKDPVENGLVIEPTVKIILFEGLYLHLDISPWSQIMHYSDDSWFVEIEKSVARDRLAKRHVQSGICDTLEQGYERADFNDLPNGDFIIEHNQAPNLYISGSAK